MFRLVGKVPAGGRLTVTMTDLTMPLNNDGDEVVLVDGSGVASSRGAYEEGQAKPGAVNCTGLSGQCVQILFRELLRCVSRLRAAASETIGCCL